MPNRFPIRGLLAWVLVLLFTAGASAAGLYLDARPTNLDPKDRFADLLLREIPRQMLIITAMDELGADVIDPSLEQGALPRNGDVRLGLERKQNRETHVLHVELFDGDNNVIDKTDIKYDFLAHGVARTRDLVASMENQDRGRWRGLLKQRLGINQPRTVNWDPSLSAPAEAQRYLATIDFQSAYLAARITHRAIAQSGESPARLHVLVRAYANLGDATRDLVTAQSAAMFARAYIYAQRLVRLAPEDPASWYHRAYLETVHGMVLDAQADFKRGDELAHGAAAPSWVELARLALAYNTVELYKRSDGPDAPLASYFAWTTIEHSGLSGMTINLAKRALQNNPNSLRAQDSIAWNSSVSYLAESPAISARILNRMMGQLINLGEAPAPIQEAVRRGADQGFPPAVMRDTLAEIAAQPRDSDEPHLPWAGYVSIVREWQFNQVFTRLYYIDHGSCGDPTGEALESWPLVSQHRYAPIIASFDESGKLGGHQAIERIKTLQFSDNTLAFCALYIHHHLIKIGILEEPRSHNNWNDHTHIQGDRSAYDIAQGFWIYRYTNGASYVETLANDAIFLDELAPDHPVALIWSAQYNWDKVAPRAARLEKELSGNPTVVYALGLGYAKAKEYDHAAELLTKAALYAPDKPVYEGLAEIHMAQHDVDGYLATWDQYFQVTPETGALLGETYRQIALRLMDTKHFDKAVPFARSALGGVAGAPEVYLSALTRSGDYGQAEAFARDMGVGGFYYRWCRETGRGNLEAARAQTRASLASMSRRGSGYVTDAAMFHLLEGEVDEAAQLLSGADPIADPAAAHLLALIRFEQKQPDEARQILQQRATVTVTDPKVRSYVLAAKEIDRCLADASALPVADRELALNLDDIQRYATQGNVYYLFGRTCELQGHLPEARQWYRKSLDALSSNFSTRCAAGEALRKLGEEYYK